MDVTREVILCCGVMQLVFITMFFGSFGSWAYYTYVLVMGVAASSVKAAPSEQVVWFLSVLALLGLKTTVINSYRLWTTTSPSRATDGLWASTSEQHEWSEVRRLSASHKATLLAYDGCADLLFPEFQKPVGVWIHPGLVLPVELQRKESQLLSARIIVVPLLHPVYDDFLGKWPELTHTLAGTTVIWRGKFFEVRERRK